MAVLDDYPLNFEDLKQPKRRSKLTKTTKQAYDKHFGKFDDAYLITGIARTLYLRHRGGLWLTVALAELTYIIWKAL